MLRILLRVECIQDVHYMYRLASLPAIRFVILLMLLGTILYKNNIHAVRRHLTTPPIRLFGSSLLQSLFKETKSGLGNM